MTDDQKPDILDTTKYLVDHIGRLQAENERLRGTDFASRMDMLSILRHFVEEVNKQAEENMLKTGVVSGAHWNAMKQVLARTEALLDEPEPSATVVAADSEAAHDKGREEAREITMIDHSKPNCPYCSSYNTATHENGCPQTVGLSDSEKVKILEHGHDWRWREYHYDWDKVQRAQKQISVLQGKCAVLRHENNRLRAKAREEARDTL